MSLRINNRQGKQLAVYVDGEQQAPVLLLSNSLGTDYRMWQAQVEALKSQFRIVRYDTRGHGQSDVIDNTTLADLAHDVIDILDALHIDKAHFCGISMGGLTALQLGIYHAERFNSIGIANSAAKIWNSEGWQARAQTVRTQGLTEIVASTHSRWFSENFDYQHQPLAQLCIQSLAETDPLGYAQSCLALADADLRSLVAAIQIPSLIIAGHYDPVTTLADAQFLQQQIPRSQQVELAASHLSNIEQPDQFTQALSQFIVNIQ